MAFTPKDGSAVITFGGNGKPLMLSRPSSAEFVAQGFGGEAVAAWGRVGVEVEGSGDPAVVLQRRSIAPTVAPRIFSCRSLSLPG